MSKKNKYEDFDDEFEYEDDDEIEIDWAGIFRKLLAHWKLFLITAVITLVIAVPIVHTIPKYYQVEVKLTPETTSGRSSGGSLSSIMSSFGLGGVTSSGADAIGPTLYPDLMNSKAFLVSLFDIPVVSKDKKIKTFYYDYLHKYQKEPVWTSCMKFFAPKDSVKASQIVNVGSLTPVQAGVAGIITKKVTCDVDNKTGVITIEVKDQDPVICATIADSTCKRLQEFITEYRSKKARKEMLDAEKQYNQSVADYNAAKAQVEGFNDSNWDLVEQDFIVEQQDLENKMQLAFQTMSAFKTQLISARQKYETSLPVYTVLDGASVPLSPAGPKRSFIIIGILFFILFVEVAVVLFKDKAKAGIASLKETPKE